MHNNSFLQIILTLIRFRSFAMCIMPYWLSTNHELYAPVSNLTFKYTALLLVMPVRRSQYVPLEMVFVDKHTIAHEILIVLWLLAEYFMNLWVAIFCLLFNSLEQILQIIGQLSWTREICWLKSYLEAIDFPYLHEWRRFWWIANFRLRRFPDDVV